MAKVLQEHFGHKRFLRHQAPGFEQFTLVNAYKVEEETFLKAVRPVTHEHIPAGSNVICSHVLYKVKQNDNGSLKLKARIAPHGNEDDLKNVLSKDCMTCPPTSNGFSNHWILFLGGPCTELKKAAFLQTGEAQRDVCVRSHRESKMKARAIFGYCSLRHTDWLTPMSNGIFSLTILCWKLDLFNLHISCSYSTRNKMDAWYSLLLRLWTIVRLLVKVIRSKGFLTSLTGNLSLATSNMDLSSFNSSESTLYRMTNSILRLTPTQARRCY